MKYLFFFVHPSKVHLFRGSINYLKSKGHEVDIVITSKDVLADLIVKEGWDYINIFPRGRKKGKLPKSLNVIIDTFLTIYRLWKLTRNKKYDLFITDDLLGFVGKIRKVPTIVYCDDDLSIIKKFSIVFMVTDFILSPDITNMGKFSHKKIPFMSYKQLAYLHPNNFKVDKSKIQKYIGENKRYFIIRTVSLTAYHDKNRRGLSDENMIKIIHLLKSYGEVYISSERLLKKQFERYRLVIDPVDLLHVLSGADIYIGDSQTMSSEAAILGVPTFRINDFVGEISVMEELESKYGLSKNYKPEQFDLFYNDLSKLLIKENYKDDWNKKRNKLLSEKGDLTKFMSYLFEQFPQSIQEIRSNPDIHKKFIFYENN